MSFWSIFLQFVVFPKTRILLTITLLSLTAFMDPSEASCKSFWIKKLKLLLT